eukprot:359695-Chlamydomonas_euryale.AAC.2
MRKSSSPRSPYLMSASPSWGCECARMCGRGPCDVHVKLGRGVGGVKPRGIGVKALTACLDFSDGHEASHVLGDVAAMCGKCQISMGVGCGV